MSDLDPLSALRNYYKKYGDFSNVVYDDGFVVLDGERLSEAAPTAFKRQLNTHEDYFYTVKDVLFFIDNFGLNIDQYRQKVVMNKVKAVIQQDKDNLKKYIDGNKALDFCIDNTNSLTYSLNHLFIYSLPHFLTSSLTSSLSYLLTHFLTLSLTSSLSYLLIHFLTLSLTSSLSHSLRDD